MSGALDENSGTAQENTVIEHVENRDTWPLSFPERQMAAENYLHPESTDYNVNFTLELSGPLNLAALERSLRSFVTRHRIMRSYYPAINGEVVRKVSDDCAAGPDILERRRCGADELRLVIESLNKPFDIGRAPLFRFTLVEIEGEAERHVLALWVHHIVMDFGAFYRFLSDLKELYGNGGEYPATDDSPDYLDYALWAAENDDLEGKKKFFTDMFADGVPENEMPIRSLRPPQLSAATNAWERRRDISALAGFAKRMGISRFSVFFAAFALALAKYCDSRDVTLGVAVSGRTRPETARMAGMFANLLPVRVKIDPDEGIAEYVRRVADTLNGLKAAQDCPFESLTPILAPDRNESRHPLFDVIVNWLIEPSPFAVGGLTISTLPRVLQDLRVDLKLEMFIWGDDMRASLAYSPELYDDSVTGGMMDQFEVIMDRIAAWEGGPGKTAGDLADLPDAHRRKVLEDFAGRKIDDDGRTIVDLFRERAAEAPGRRAVLFQDISLSFGEVDAKTDAIASALRKIGIGKGCWVGLLLKRSEKMPVCALGVLKTGAGYVPLDPTYPTERLEFMLKDSGAGTVIADAGLEDLIPGFGGTRIGMSEIEGMGNGGEEAPSLSSASPLPGDQLVLLYTSGTTGQPKGVTLTHGNLANFCRWLIEEYAMTGDDLVAAYASFGFDACLMDMYPTLASGAAIYIVPEEMRLDLPLLNNSFNKYGVTIAFMTTQLGRQFAVDMPNKSLRILTIGGETLAPISPPTSFRLNNAYGPTECTILSTLFKVDRLYDRVPLGKPPANTAIYILSKLGGLAPVGVAGELCIAGRQVGAGYLNRPELTAEKFVKNPFSSDPDYSRMYKTGDIARFLPDGNVDFIGRSDFQVKIRGFRVELPEIELRIRAYKGVKDAAVVALDAPGGGKCAVAYIVADSPIDITDLNAFIEDKLPPYMVPAATTQVDAIPLNPNGKVDRKKLPPPAFAAGDEDGEGGEKNRAPSDLERAISEVIKEILGHDRFNANTNLLRAGLASLSAIRLCVRLDSRLGAAPSVPEVMKTPTLLGIENAIIKKLLAHRSEEDGEKPDNAGLAEGGYPLSGSQAGVCFDCIKRPGSTVYNIPFYLKFSPSVDARRLAKAAAIIIDAHPVVKSRLATVGEEARMLPGDAPAEVTCDETSENALADIIENFVRPFDIFKGPLYRARVCRTPEGVTLLADFHHMAFDGGSLDIFLR
ncbi:MAG: amino acid adenylation domain-containing protein, partial [Synergistaceae bacterium]|nr:amino acid adenylation domain-containing protein [Synergistaceae bacterium]